MNGREKEIAGTLKAALEAANDCDQILVIMQKKEGGYIFFAPDGTRFETASFMAQHFLWHLHNQVEE